MTRDEIILSEGNHLSIKPQMRDARGILFGETGQVRLLLATQLRQAIAPGPGRPQSATTLAVDMDDVATLAVLRDLRDIAEKMGWLPQPEA